MADIVSAGTIPTVVAPDLIASLKIWAGTEVDIITLQPDMRPGDHVQVTNGPLQGLSGTIVRECKESIRVTILLSFLQTGAQVTMERSDLRLIA